MCENLWKLFLINHCWEISKRQQKRENQITSNNGNEKKKKTKKSKTKFKKKTKIPLTLSKAKIMISYPPKNFTRWHSKTGSPRYSSPHRPGPARRWSLMASCCKIAPLLVTSPARPDHLTLESRGKPWEKWAKVCPDMTNAWCMYHHSIYMTGSFLD